MSIKYSYHMVCVIADAFLTFDFQVLEEVLKHESSVMFVNDMELNNWISIINKLYHDPELRSFLASNAKKEVEKYTWDKRAQSILSIIY